MAAIATYNFQSKTILITGGAGDIGAAAARRFAEGGAGVVLLDINEAQLAAVAADLKSHNTPVHTFCCDVTNAEQVKQTMAQATEQAGRLDYLFNNAGFQGAFARTDDYPEADFEKVIGINVVGVFNVLKAVAQQMRDAGGGAIVNMASHAGVAGPPNMLAYAASKFTVVGMTQTAAKDLAPYNIRVNAISPALIGPGMMWARQTELQAAVGSQYFDSDPKVVEQQMVDSVPLRRLGRLEEVANGVAFLLSEEASYVTGFNLELTGGIN